jgi:hypothetical protein
MVINDNINSYDLLFINNAVSNKLLVKEEEYKNIDESVRLYKDEIKTKIDKLLNSYLDDNNKPKNNNKKYKHCFYNFLVSVIDSVEHQKLKNLVSNDLSGVTNNTHINTDDTCYNLLSIDMNLINENKNMTKKIGNMNNFVSISSSVQKPIILPQIRIKR